MKFLKDDFLLSNATAKSLFEKAKQLPIIDYHNHLDPKAIAEDRKITSIADLWVVSDPYKHRAMRIAGVEERKISGNASGEEKFEAWADVCANSWGNPLFHWSAMELKSVFGIDEVLCKDNAKQIMDECNRVIAEKNLTTNSILRSWNIEALCTSDDLLDDVSIHTLATKNSGGFSVMPSLRADSIFAFQMPTFAKWFERLNAMHKVENLADYISALSARLDAFESASCKLADHSLDSGWSYIETDEVQASKIFEKALSNSADATELVMLKSYILHWLALEYGKRGWVLQLHIGAERYTSSRLRALAGGAGGYATIGKACDITSLVRFIDSVEKSGSLGKIILYTLNPADNQALSVLTGSFSQDGVWGKLQFGPAWWYNDHLEGIKAHLKSLESFGLLSKFIGMTTDSRSILSFSRHEYFRRIICSHIGEMAERGEIPQDEGFLVKAVSDISYNNAKNWIF